MKIDNFVSNKLKNYIWYISVTTRPPQVCIPGYAPESMDVRKSERKREEAYQKKERQKRK